MTRARAKREQRQRQWDDWRCYRCGQHYASSEEPGQRVQSLAGFSMPICRSCAEKEDASVQ